MDNDEILMTDIEFQLHQYHGSYRYLCFIGGVVVWSHTPIGMVLKDFQPAVVLRETA